MRDLLLQKLRPALTLGAVVVLGMREFLALQRSQRLDREQLGA